MDELTEKLLRSLRYHPVQLQGRLLAIHDSGQFKLALEDGTETPGMLSESLPVNYLAGFLGQPVVVFGIGASLPSAQLLVVFAEGCLPLVTTPPKVSRLPGQSPQERALMAERLKKAIGAWPGDETDEQVDEVLSGRK
ncbi:MAG: hypothetical protein L0241_08170 [Planctomycetia bacterium]|nr:hypothetical protein [Planctomycetia bacterium]